MVEEPVETGVFDIDWRSLKSALERCLSEASGVVHVRLENADAPETTFLRVLVERWLQPRWPETAFTIVYVEPSDAATRNASGIAAKLVSECGLPRRQIEPPVTPIVQIMQGMNAQSIEVSNVQVAVEVSGYATALAGAPLDDLRAGLAGFLGDHKLIVIVRDLAGFDVRTRADIGREVWDGCLARYRHSGVLLVCLWELADEQKVMDDARFPPMSDASLDLPAVLGGADIESAARDVANIALRRGWSEEEQHARGFADAQVGIGGTISSLHARLHIFENNWRRTRVQREGAS